MDELTLIAPPIHQDGTRRTAPTDRGAEAAPPVMKLRGATVEVDAGLVFRVVAVACLAGLALLVAVLFAAGVEKNDQIARLHRHGVAVTITVSGCRGQLGGSGTNQAGYTCRGTFTLDGRRYNEPIPGSTLYAPGTTLRAFAVPADPALLALSGALRTEHPSWTAFVLPIILSVVLVVLTAGAVVLARSRHRPSPAST